MNFTESSSEAFSLGMFYKLRHSFKKGSDVPVYALCATRCCVLAHKKTDF